MCKRPGLFADQMEFLEKYFNECDVRNMSRVERNTYDYYLKVYRDIKDNENYWKNEVKKAIARGEARGRFEYKKEMAQKMKADGLPMDMIVKYSGLTESEIARL